MRVSFVFFFFPSFRPDCGRRDYFSASKGGGAHLPWPVRENTLDKWRGRFFRDPMGRMPALAGVKPADTFAEK